MVERGEWTISGRLPHPWAVSPLGLSSIWAMFPPDAPVRHPAGIGDGDKLTAAIPSAVSVCASSCAHQLALGDEKKI